MPISVPGSQAILRNKILQGMYSHWRYRIGLPLAQSVVAMLLFTISQCMIVKPATAGAIQGE